MNNVFNEEYVLFSPVGTTDPIRGYKDGPLLHIARVYRPKKIYIYLSKEMEKLHLKDNRYEKALSSIGYKKEQIEFIFTKDSNNNPADFEIYYEEFPVIYDKIEKESKGKKILLNITSGTPQMNSFIYHSDIENTIHIQVLNPERKAGTTERTNTENYSIDDEIEFNEDNIEDFESRAIEATKNNVTRYNTIKTLTKLLDNFEYNSSYELIKGSVLFNKDIKELIKIGSFKENLNLSEGYEFVKNKKYLEKYYPFKYDELFEYIVNLQMKLDKKMYLDFARGVTPIIDRLLEVYVEKIVGFKIKETMVGDKVDFSLVPDDIFNEFAPGEFKLNRNKEYLNRRYLRAIIKTKGQNNEEILQHIDTLNDFYNNVRNISAHQIIYIDEKIINEKCGVGSHVVLNSLKNIYISINRKATLEDFKLLQNLNKDIKLKL